VGFRFRRIGGISAAVMALLALLHDILIAYFTFVIFRIPLNDNFVAVVLTILGYSLNDTIVIYDRIRENRTKMDKKSSISDIVNLSLNQSLSRNIITSLCVFIAIGTVAVIAIVTSMESIISFAVPMTVGVIAGFYSSTFLCTPLWALWVEHSEKRAAKGKKNK
jgi:preprotein translocase subunit SecF